MTPTATFDAAVQAAEREFPKVYRVFPYSYCTAKRYDYGMVLITVRMYYKGQQLEARATLDASTAAAEQGYVDSVFHALVRRITDQLMMVP